MANLESDYYCRWYKLHYNSLTGRWLLQVWGGRGRLVGYFVHCLARQCRTTALILNCEILHPPPQLLSICASMVIRCRDDHLLENEK